MNEVKITLFEEERDAATRPVLKMIEITDQRTGQGLKIGGLEFHAMPAFLHITLSIRQFRPSTEYIGSALFLVALPVITPSALLTIRSLFIRPSPPITRSPGLNNRWNVKQQLNQFFVEIIIFPSPSIFLQNASLGKGIQITGGSGA